MVGKVFGITWVSEVVPLGVAIRGCFEVGLLSLSGSGELAESLVQKGFTIIGSFQESGERKAARMETNRWRGDERPEARG